MLDGGECPRNGFGGAVGKEAVAGWVMGCVVRVVRSA